MRLKNSLQSENVLIVSALFTQDVGPLVVVHLHRVEQGTVFALVDGVYIGALIDQNGNDAHVLQP